MKTDPAARLAKLSRRTLDRFLAEKKLLSDSELGMLGQLDAREVSRFASRYFLAMEDGMVEEDLDQETSTSRSHLGSQSSRFGAICAQLALDGTREAAPGLLEAMRQKKFLSPTPLGPYRLQWLAALSIARRDPWPDVDAWLAENIDNQETVDHRSRRGRGNRRHGGRPAAGPARQNARSVWTSGRGRSATCRTETARFSLRHAGRRAAGSPVVEAAVRDAAKPRQRS